MTGHRVILEKDRRTSLGIIIAAGERITGVDDVDVVHGEPCRVWVVTRTRLALALKRGIDIAGAAVAIVVLSPILAWTALAVVIALGRPILFRQERPGLYGKPFEIVKFRTMRPPRPGEVWYITDQQRTTRLGRFLRSTSIDELPELWNVVRGEMSLVGPRPLLMEYLATYTSEERRRHNMRPGIAGWAAVNGRHTLRFEDRLRLDVWYVDHWSLRLDMKIVAMTLSQVLRRTDVVESVDAEALGFRLPGVGSRAPMTRPGDLPQGGEAGIVPFVVEGANAAQVRSRRLP